VKEMAKSGVALGEIRLVAVGACCVGLAGGSEASVTGTRQGRGRQVAEKTDQSRVSKKVAYRQQ